MGASGWPDMRPLDTLRTALMRSSRTFVWSATASGLVVLLSFFSAIGYDLHRATLHTNEQAAANVATLLEQDIARNLELYNLSLQGVLDDIGDPNVMAQEPTLRQKILFDRSATAQGLGALVALDRMARFFSIRAAPSRARAISPTASISSPSGTPRRTSGFM